MFPPLQSPLASPDTYNRRNTIHFVAQPVWPPRAYKTALSLIGSGRCRRFQNGSKADFRCWKTFCLRRSIRLLGHDSPQQYSWLDVSHLQSAQASPSSILCLVPTSSGLCCSSSWRSCPTSRCWTTDCRGLISDSTISAAEASLPQCTQILCLIRKVGFWRSRRLKMRSGRTGCCCPCPGASCFGSFGRRSKSCKCCRMNCCWRSRVNWNSSLVSDVCWPCVFVLACLLFRLCCWECSFYLPWSSSW